MQFRYQLAKKTFKNKKIPPKKAPGEDLISADQRGDHSSEDVSLLSLNKDAKRKEEAPREDKEMSRRELFSFGRLSDFADAVEEGEKKAPPREREPTSNGVESEPAQPAADENRETADDSAAPAQEPEAQGPGFFKRIASKFKRNPGAVQDPPAQAAGEDPVAEDSGNAPPVGVEPAAEPPASRLDAYLADSEEDEGEVDPEYSRRNLLRQGVHFFAKPAIESVQNKINKVNNAVDSITKRVPLIRPPGALSEQAFLKACTRCDECVNACPKDAIVKVPKKLGFLIMGTPYIDPKKVPCVMCDDLPCIPACPDGALKPVTTKFDVKMGYAILDKAKCQAYGDTFCQQCIIDCPIPGAIDQVQGKPVINKKACTGCGVCVLSCSTVNIPVAIKIKPQMVIESQLRKKRLEKERARIEAEREAERQAALAEKAGESETDTPGGGDPMAEGSPPAAP
ncbi:MAG: hypothetical protein JSU88_01455 [Nitrospinaceae bacterium]|nr:MAG: hypothetical protein JSU88_01455 [Nitrospinaceae bacterium]